jgi:hypothetical protein
MADPAPINTHDSTKDTLEAITQYYPQLAAAYNAQVKPQAETQLGVAQEISPQYQKLLSDLYAQYGPQVAKIGSNIDTQNRTDAANADVNLLQNQGKQLAQAYREADQIANPETSAVRTQSASALGQLLNSVNLDNADPEAERLVNQENIRTGATSSPENATQTVSNALQFGQQRQGRINTLSNAISQATAFLQPSSSSSTFNPATAATGKSASTTGQSQFAGVTNPSDQAYQNGNNFMNSVSGFQSNVQNIAANRRDVVDRINEGFSAL